MKEVSLDLTGIEGVDFGLTGMVWNRGGRIGME
jgi:hypothetical protein